LREAIQKKQRGLVINPQAWIATRLTPLAMTRVMQFGLDDVLSKPAKSLGRIDFCRMLAYRERDGFYAVSIAFDLRVRSLERPVPDLIL
jgi:hypothetical protein